MSIQNKAVKSKNEEKGPWYIKLVEYLGDKTSDMFLNIAYTPLISLVKNEILKLLQKIQINHLEVITVEKEKYYFGKKKSEGDKTVTLLVKNNRFWLRVAMFSDLGLAESYLLDECEISNIADFLKLLVFNRSELTGQNGSTDITSKVFQTLDYISNTQLVNSINNTLNNISAHYDLGNDFFELFLDPTLTYSCPIWEELHDNEDEVRTKSLDEEFDELYSAQLRKLHTIIRKAKLCKEDHLLEIGSGWGALSIEAVKLTGCKVTTLTLSIEQKLLAEKKIAEAGYDTKINVVLMDYRDLLKSGMKFDKIISIEMIEAVGKEYLSTYFNCCHSVLKEEGGIMVLQGITIHESRYDDYCSRVDYIQKYIFPGGHTPSITALVNAIKDGSDNQLVINDINNIGMHYTRALRLWREKFILNYEKIRQIDPTKYDDIFKRTWLFYLAYCEAGFATHCIGDIIMVLSRPNNQAIHEGIPM